MNKFLNLGVNDPGIATPAICGLLIVAILLSGLILLAPWLARHLKAGAISGRKWEVSVRKEQISVLQRIMGLIAFVFALVGAAMARVQVSKSVSALLEAQATKQKDSPTTHAEEEGSEVFWISIWVAVALLGCNLLALVFRGVGDIRKKQHLVVLE
jgi:preprotein translocase subunit SecG